MMKPRANRRNLVDRSEISVCCFALYPSCVHSVVKGLHGCLKRNIFIRVLFTIGTLFMAFKATWAEIVIIHANEDGEFLYLTMNDDILGLYGKGFKDNDGLCGFFKTNIYLDEEILKCIMCRHLLTKGMVN